MSHTPGPWELADSRNGRKYIYRGEEIVTPHVCVTKLGLKDDRSMSNARLMAAAPELLKALEEILSITDRDHDAWHRARRVISKAKGI